MPWPKLGGKAQQKEHNLLDYVCHLAVWTSVQLGAVWTGIFWEVAKRSLHRHPLIPWPKLGGRAQQNEHNLHDHVLSAMLLCVSPLERSVDWQFLGDATCLLFQKRHCQLPKV